MLVLLIYASVHYYQISASLFGVYRFLSFQNILIERNMENISEVVNDRYGGQLDYRIYMLISILIY